MRRGVDAKVNSGASSGCSRTGSEAKHNHNLATTGRAADLEGVDLTGNPRGRIRQRYGDITWGNPLDCLRNLSDDRGAGIDQFESIAKRKVAIKADAFEAKGLRRGSRQNRELIAELRLESIRSLDA